MRPGRTPPARGPGAGREGPCGDRGHPPPPVPGTDDDLGHDQHAARWGVRRERERAEGDRSRTGQADLVADGGVPGELGPGRARVGEAALAVGAHRRGVAPGHQPFAAPHPGEGAGPGEQSQQRPGVGERNRPGHEGRAGPQGPAGCGHRVQGKQGRRGAARRIPAIIDTCPGPVWRSGRTRSRRCSTRWPPATTARTTCSPSARTGGGAAPSSKPSTCARASRLLDLAAGTGTSHGALHRRGRPRRPVRLLPRDAARRQRPASGPAVRRGRRHPPAVRGRASSTR